MGKKELKERILKEMVINYVPLWELAKEIYNEHCHQLKPEIGLSEIYNRLVELEKEVKDGTR